ncbi:hypothetical protein GCM10010331_53790 [Streptomyces xanthochromogenes]|nr:hypothetical protein GCM10010331_53790 [Streptomyces xanthochromogenes]
MRSGGDELPALRRRYGCGPRVGGQPRGEHRGEGRDPGRRAAERAERAFAKVETGLGSYPGPKRAPK